MVKQAGMTGSKTPHAPSRIVPPACPNGQAGLWGSKAPKASATGSGLRHHGRGPKGPRPEGEGAAGVVSRDARLILGSDSEGGIALRVVRMLVEIGIQRVLKFRVCLRMRQKEFTQLRHGPAQRLWFLGQGQVEHCFGV